MKALIVLTFNVPTPDDLGEVLLAIDPPSLPHFEGNARVTVDPYATEIERWLDQ
jgi:hypothetical protein